MPAKEPRFYSKNNHERKMIADVLRLGNKFPNLWMSFQLDVTDLVQWKEDKTAESPFPGYPTCFLMAYAQVIDQHRGFLGHVKRDKIEVPKEVKMRISSRNVQGRTVTRILTNPHLLDADAINGIFKQLLVKRDEILTPQQQFFFRLPWWLRNLFYQYWMSSLRLRGEVFGYCYFACNGTTQLNGPFTAHTASPGSLGLYFSDVFTRDQRWYVTLSATVDHSVADAYHLTFLAEQIEEALKKMAAVPK